MTAPGVEEQPLCWCSVELTVYILAGGAAMTHRVPEAEACRTQATASQMTPIS